MFFGEVTVVAIKILVAKINLVGIESQPALKVNNGNTRTMCEICSKLTIKLQERRQWHLSGVFVVNFEHILHIILIIIEYVIDG